MATGVHNYDATAANNTTIQKDGGGTHAISDSMATDTIDNVKRQIMADLANFLNWPVKTTAYTAVAYDAIQADTVTTAAFTVTLPSSPSAGHWVKVVAASTWASNNLTIGRNSSTIRGNASDLVLSDAIGAAYEFFYDGSTWQYAKIVELTAAAVDAVGATMNTDTDVSGNSWVLDEDNMSSDSATKVPTQQSVKAYVDSNGVDLSAVAEDILPDADSTRDLGSSSKAFAEVHTDKLLTPTIRKPAEGADRDVSAMSAAWVSFQDNGTFSVLDSLNTSSVTDNGVGDYTPNWTANLGSTSYVLQMTATYNTDTSVLGLANGDQKAVGSSRFENKFTSSQANDDAYGWCDITIHGDLA